MVSLHTTLVASRALSPTVRHLVLRTERPLPFDAGQWVNLHVPLPDGSVEKRAYSIASAPRPGDADCDLDIIVTNVDGGLVSPVLHGLQVGAGLQCDGPHGFFVRDAASAEGILLVGTGTGLAPLRAIAQEVLATTSLPLGLLFGVRTAADILFRGELEGWASKYPQFTLDITLSRPDVGWSGRTGHVQKHLADVLGEERPQVFICGLSPMVREVRALLKSQLGYDRKRVHSERYD